MSRREGTCSDSLRQFNFLIPPCTYEQIRSIAHDRRVPQAVVVRYGIELALARLNGAPDPPLDF